MIGALLSILISVLPFILHLTYLKSSPLFILYHIPAVLNYIDEVRDLGIIMTSNLSFNKYILKVVYDGCKLIGFIQRYLNSFSDVFLMVHLALIRPSLKYCSFI